MTILITSRRADALLSGEDVEIAYVACRLGFGMGVFPELRLTHLISKERVSPEYLLRLCEGVGMSDALLEHKWLGTVPRSWSRPRSLIAIVKNFIFRRGFDRRVYLARLRALRTARRVILSSERKTREKILTNPHE